MFATSLLSLVLLTLSGLLLDAHRRAWREAKASQAGPSRLARGRVVRRSFASGAIAVVGCLVILWPVTPREPFWVVLYGATLASLATMIFAAGVWDAWVTSKHLRAESRRQVAEQTKALVKAVEEHRSAARRSADAEAARV